MHIPQNNAGGPLICEDEVVALQTYIVEDTCKPPNLYQLISSWRKFITCGLEYNCQKDFCTNTCHVVPKDVITEENPTTASVINTIIPVVNTTILAEVKLVSVAADTPTTMSSVFPMHSSVPTTEITNIDEIITKKITRTSTEDTTPELSLLSDIKTLNTEIKTEVQINGNNIISKSTLPTTVLNNEQNITNNIENIMRDSNIQEHKKITRTRSAAKTFYLLHHLLFGPIIVKTLF